MKQTPEKIAETFGQSCYKNDVVGLCITINEKNNTNSIGLNATARETGFMIRQLVERLAVEYLSNDMEFKAFCEELAKMSLTKKKIVH